jgi:hypothetical protein
MPDFSCCTPADPCSAATCGTTQNNNCGQAVACPACPPPCGVLESGQSLGPNQSITSCDGTHVFVMQGDGNLVLYHGPALWNSGTFGHPGAVAVMQGDGNLVIYVPGAVLWNSGSFGHPGAQLYAQGDGNVVIYAGGVAVWNTGTAGR